MLGPNDYPDWDDDAAYDGPGYQEMLSGHEAADNLRDDVDISLDQDA